MTRMSRFLGLLAFAFVSDIALTLGVWNTLPNTGKLKSGIEVQRINQRGERFIFLAGPKNRKYVALSSTPKVLRYAILELEDDRFFQHNGFDFDEIWSALSSHLEYGRRLRGASTISQQLVKNLYLTPERTFKRKILEALITLKLEMTLTKNQILEIYLNSIDWGRGLFGIQEAAQFYFKKRPAELSLKESIFLAAIIPNPRRFATLDEEQTPKLFVRRQMTRALNGLFQSGLINVADYEQALAEPISINP